MVSDIDTSLLILLLLGLRLVDFLCNYQSLKNGNLTIAAFFLKVDYKAIKTKDGAELEPCWQLPFVEVMCMIKFTSFENCLVAFMRLPYRLLKDF